MEVTIVKKQFRWTAILLIAALILSLMGCASTKEAALEETLAFPGIRWDMNPQDVINALNLKEGQYTQQEEPYDAERENSTGSCFIGIQGYTVFGAGAEVSLRFTDYGTGNQVLQTIYVIYPADTDMEKVKAAMTKAYGEPTGSEGEHCVNWCSSETVYDFLSQEFPDWVAQAESQDAGKAVDSPTPQPQQWKQTPLIQVQWWDESEEYLRMMFDQPNILSFTSCIGIYRELAQKQ